MKRLAGILKRHREGNQTLSTYDMGDRRTEVNHPASGITSFTYDALPCPKLKTIYYE